MEHWKERTNVLICETSRTDRYMETERKLGLLGGWGLGGSEEAANRHEVFRARMKIF